MEGETVRLILKANFVLIPSQGGFVVEGPTTGKSDYRGERLPTPLGHRQRRAYVRSGGRGGQLIRGNVSSNHPNDFHFVMALDGGLASIGYWSIGKLEVETRISPEGVSYRRPLRTPVRIDVFNRA